MDDSSPKRRGGREASREGIFVMGHEDGEGWRVGEKSCHQAELQMAGPLGHKELFWEGTESRSLWLGHQSPGEGNGHQLQYPCLENSMDRGAWGQKELYTTEQLTLPLSGYQWVAGAGGGTGADQQ